MDLPKSSEHLPSEVHFFLLWPVHFLAGCCRPAPRTDIAEGGRNGLCRCRVWAGSAAGVRGLSEKLTFKRSLEISFLNILSDLGLEHAQTPTGR